jgi:PleD family two-component response regulator
VQDSIIFLITRVFLNSMPRILLVDDYGSYRKAVSRFFSSCGYEVVTAGDGVEGLMRLKEEGSICAILTDYNMPVMDGFEMAKAIREDEGFTAYSGIPIIGVGDFPGVHRHVLDSFSPKGGSMEDLLEIVDFYCRT